MKKYKYTSRDYAILKAFKKELEEDVTILYKNGNVETLKKKDAISKIYDNLKWAMNIRVTNSKMINKMIR